MAPLPITQTEKNITLIFQSLVRYLNYQRAVQVLFLQLAVFSSYKRLLFLYHDFKVVLWKKKFYFRLMVIKEKVKKETIHILWLIIF